MEANKLVVESESVVNNGLEFNLQVERDAKGVRFELQVKNLQSHPLVVEFRSGQPVDFVIKQAGHPIWGWSMDRMFTQVIQDIRINQGESLGPYTGKWDFRTTSGQPSASGQYELDVYFFGISRTEPVLTTWLEI